MPSRRTLILAAAALAVGSSSVVSALAEDASAEAFLGAIYKKLAAGKGDSGGQIYWLDAKDRTKWFSAALVKQWAAAEDRAKAGGDEASPIDFDPFTNSQDPQLKGYKIEKLDAVPPVTKLRVTLKGGYATPGDGVLVFDLVQEKGWKIDDIQGSAGGDRWDLKEILAMP
ncbi:MAG: hypothetical protein GX458_16315 [Phyllobacteriaceae bacterium]|nr:hypothetical protein [Phyllobacteriaceae bacterium]